MVFLITISGSFAFAEVNVAVSHVTAKSVPSKVRLASPLSSSEALNVAILLFAPLATADTAPPPPPPLAASKTNLAPSNLRNCPDVCVS